MSTTDPCPGLAGVADLTTVARVFTDDLFTFESFSLHSIVPNLRQLNLYLTPRSSQEALSSYLGHLDSFQQLQRLDLTFWVPLEPRRGLFPVFFAECLKAPQQLQVLRLDGCPLPDVAMQVGLCTCVGWQPPSISTGWFQQTCMHCGPPLTCGCSASPIATAIQCLLSPLW
jgi:hypothetical protein